jgi:hypothetical protein
MEVHRVVDVEAPIFSRHSDKRWRSDVVSLIRWLHFTPRKIPGIHFC